MGIPGRGFSPGPGFQLVDPKREREKDVPVTDSLIHIHELRSQDCHWAADSWKLQRRSLEELQRLFHSGRVVCACMGLVPATSTSTRTRYALRVVPIPIPKHVAREDSPTPTFEGMLRNTGVTEVLMGTPRSVPDLREFRVQTCMPTFAS